jgi:ABC-type transporter Mla subunit MlaD
VSILNVVWVAVIVAVAFWAAGVSAAIYVMVRAARLIGVTTTAVTSLREQSGQLMEQASAAVQRADEQAARTEAITASMEDVTSAMAELGDRLSALAPAARTVADGIGAPLARAAAVVYGVNRALRMRRASRPQARVVARARCRPAPAGSETASAGPGDGALYGRAAAGPTRALRKAPR